MAENPYDIKITAPHGVDYSPATLVNQAFCGGFEEQILDIADTFEDSYAGDYWIIYGLEPTTDTQTEITWMIEDDGSGNFLSMAVEDCIHYLTDGAVNPCKILTIDTDTYPHGLFIGSSDYPSDHIQVYPQTHFIYISAYIKGTIAEGDTLSILPYMMVQHLNTTTNEWTLDKIRNPAYALVQGAGHFDDWTRISAVVVTPDNIDNQSSAFEYGSTIVFLKKADSTDITLVDVDAIQVFLLNDFYNILHSPESSEQ